MAQSSWQQVSSESPCPICKKSDGMCAITRDGKIAKCMRIEAGSFKTKRDRNGAEYYLHDLAGERQGSSSPPPRPPGGAARRADDATVNAVYASLLDAIPMPAAFTEELRQKRGLSAEAIDRNKYRPVPTPQARTKIAKALHEVHGDCILGVPGFQIKEGKYGPFLTWDSFKGLLIPCRDLDGRILALKVRAEETLKDGSRYRYVSSAGNNGPGATQMVHIPLGIVRGAELVRVTEGELKADICWDRSCIPTLSIPGVGSWKLAIPVLREMQARIVRVAWDADCWDKPTVARPLAEFVQALACEGFTVQLEQWDQADGKGIDDLLVAGKVPTVLDGKQVDQVIQQILASATSGEDPAPPSELERLQEVLNSGGSEALFRDKKLMQALADLSRSDPAEFAAIEVSISGKVSARALTKAIRPYLPKRPAASGSSDGGQYSEVNGRVCVRREKAEGEIEDVPLCNFTARIVGQISRDDGAEETGMLLLEGLLNNGTKLPRSEVLTADYGKMDWVISKWGARAIVNAGRGASENLRAAIQHLSGEIPFQTVYCHTGWRCIEDRWVYLHANGAIGAEGLDEEIQVDLPGSLDGFCLPLPPTGKELITAVGASLLGFLRLGPDKVVFPMLAAAYRAVLGDSDFGLFLAGASGCYKSQAAALVQQHFGAGMNSAHLPANWKSTSNAIEGLAFHAKDAVLVIDDFTPQGSSIDRQKHEQSAERIFRGQGNHSGRQRMRHDGSLRPEKPPRGLVFATGEDVPRVQSVRARLLILEISPGDLGPLTPQPNPNLTACQDDARNGLYAQAMAGFLRWLAPRFAEIKGGLRREADELRAKACAAGQHARTPGIIADLALGLRYALSFAREVDALSAEESRDLWKRGWEALTEAGASQTNHIASTEPAALFIRLLRAAIAGGYAHIADEFGEAPRDREQRYGWRSEEWNAGGEQGVSVRWKAQGFRVGWLLDGQIYLEPNVSHTVVQKLARDSGEPFALSLPSLKRRLKEQGCLATFDAKRERLTVRKMIQGTSYEVLHIAVNNLTTATDLPDDLGSADSDQQETQTAGSNGHHANGNGTRKKIPFNKLRATGGSASQSKRADAEEFEV